MHKTPSAGFQAFLWLIICACLGLSLLLLFGDGSQQDASFHFLYARWAWKHPAFFVDVWARPLFTFLYAFPALISYQATRLLTVIISLSISWQTWRLADELRIARAPFAIALVWMQPSFFLFAAENMTEPLFALAYIIALRLHHLRRINAGMSVASLMILARPEGFFLGLLWGIWVLFGIFTRYGTGSGSDPVLTDESSPSAPGRYRFPYRAGLVCSGLGGMRVKAGLRILLLATGAFLWWLAAWIITGDPLFIKHAWPADWPLVGTKYGAAGLVAYPLRLPEIVGVWLLLPFFYGLFHLLKRRKFGTITSSFLLIFLLHTVLRAYGMLGSAGYPRYCITVSPAIAVITLVGWNRMADLFSHVSRPIRTAYAALVIAMSFFFNFIYADGNEASRDARAVRQLHAWFQTHSQPVTKFIWSQAYAGILFDWDPREQPGFIRNRESNLELLRKQPPETLVYWDAKTGPKWFELEAKDFEAAGFTRLHSQSFMLWGYILDRSWFGFGGPRNQTMYLLYKSK